jgi:hypothetical protein
MAGRCVKSVASSSRWRILDLHSAASVAINGSKFKAVNARDKNFTEAKMKRRLERIDESIARYLSQLETADRHGDAVPKAKVARFAMKQRELGTSRGWRLAAGVGAKGAPMNRKCKWRLSLPRLAAAARSADATQSRQKSLNRFGASAV